MAAKIYLHIVTGFLGAGKTTFIQALLQELLRRNALKEQPEKIVYVVNEFGQSGIDKAMMAEQPLVSYELTNGCICCTLKAEFSLLLQQIITEQQPDRIIFEPSGLFLLSELFTALSGEPYSDKLLISPIVTLIDAWHDDIYARSFSPVLLNQARLADLLVISKLQARQDSALDKLVDLQLKYDDMPLLTRDAWDFTTDDWQMILDAKARPIHQVRLNATRRLISHQLLWTRQHPKLDALTIPWGSKSQADLEQQLNSLIDGQAGEIIRAKGFIRCEDRCWLIQIVHKQIEWHPVAAIEKQCLTIIGIQLQVEKFKSLFDQNPF